MIGTASQFLLNVLDADVNCICTTGTSTFAFPETTMKSTPHRHLISVRSFAA